MNARFALRLNRIRCNSLPSALFNEVNERNRRTRILATRAASSVSQFDLNSLITLLEVQVIGLSEWLVSPGFKVVIDGHIEPGLYYILSGTGKLHVKKRSSVEMNPHTLIIVPPGFPLELEVPASNGSPSLATSVFARREDAELVNSIYQFNAGESEPKTTMICGLFQARYGPSVDLFSTLSTPIVEQFDASDHLERQFKTMLQELVAKEIAAGAMTGALLKQVIVALLRRSLKSKNLWEERFSLLSDPKIARAFAEMVAEPGANHTIASLANAANQSRSIFMSRFTSVIGRTPMQLLRDLRMRQAASQLDMGIYTVDQVARNCGYTSRASFARAFKEVHGTGPRDYRQAKRT
ncbi:AraC family transcriptional regulator [Paraburkholderia sp. Cpub6]|uniref:AraC family transcriptional regulator n=1 Tax=Paraburkholderia sp. Cpub6 TaxID=2723094 RepID=UPI00161F973B|nr:AraC family transcriptional regulator [Paraburkholderia sp. Cpub6]MBB5462287.1 AraC family transcriptional activator of mtrCDE [Paraburkholderia sp. Cpub6]